MSPQPISNGVIYVSILIGCYLLRSIVFVHSMHFVTKLSTSTMNGVTSVVYQKILNLSSASRKYLDSGGIMTHINVDIMALYNFVILSPHLLSAPCMIITAIILLFI